MLLLSLMRSRTVATLFTSVWRVFADSENASASAMASPFERYCAVSESTCLPVAMLVSATVTETATSSMAPLSLGRSRTGTYLYRPYCSPFLLRWGPAAPRALSAKSARAAAPARKTPVTSLRIAPGPPAAI